MKSKAFKFLVLSWIFGLVFAVPLRAQVSGATLSGTITDAQGKDIPGAKISVKNLATNVKVETTTNDAGAYTLPNLVPAEYEVAVSAPGFSTAVSKVTLTVGAMQEMNLSLKVGQVTEQIQVTGAAAQVELVSSTLSATVEAREVRELPLNGRDWAALANLEPGVAQVRTQEAVTQVGSHARGLGMQLSIDGNRPTQNSYRLNGIFINDYSNAGPGSVLGQNLGVDAIQEFSVLTSNYSSEYGYTSGGVINAITRSGTNQFHGSAYEFLRNSALDAANFFENANGLKKAPFRRNQFGASAGGPVWKDKVFIFGDYEGLRQSKGITHVAHVLSPNLRNGIINDALGNPLPPTMANCQPNSTRLTPGATVCVDNEIAKFFTFWPTSTVLIGPANNTATFAFSGAQVVPENYVTTRGDVKFSEKDSFNSSYYYDRSSFTQPDGLNQVSDQFVVGRQGVAAEETHIFGPSMANTVRFGYSRSYGNGQLTVKAINPAAADPAFGMFPGTFAPRITAPGLTPFRGGLKGQSIQNYTLQTYQFYDDASRNIGTHNLKFGGMLVRYQLDLFAPFIEDGTATYSTLSDLLQNNAHRVSGPPNLADIKTHSNRTWIYAGYLQDDWKVLHNLTLNLGLRYEMATIPTEAHGLIANLPQVTTDPSACVSPTSCPGLNKFYFKSNPTTKNFEPRIGFAWDPFSNGKTAVRGGFGIFDALPLPYELAINNAQTAPFHLSATVVNPPQGSFPLGIAPLISNPPATQVPWNYVEPNPHRNYVYQWNLNIQRQVWANTSVTLAYAGSRGIHNPFQMDDLNTVFPTLSSAGWLFPNPVCSSQAPPACGQTPFMNRSSIVPGLLINPTAINAIQTTLWQSKSWYNSLQFQLEQRLSHGVELKASFTWSKTMDTSSGSFAGDNFAGDVTPTIPWWDLRIVKGLSDFDVRRNLFISALWEVPTPEALKGPAGWILRGWTLGGILQASDGVPVWPLNGLEGDPMGQLNSEPLAIPDIAAGAGCKSLVNPGNIQYIKAQCFINALAPSGFNFAANCDQAFITNFAAANPGQSLPANTCINLLGHLGRNTIIGPGLINLDYSMVKNNRIPKISENFNIQFRAEFFNVLNHPSFAPPTNNLEAIDPTGVPTPGFGQIDSTQTPGREIQFALKIIW